MSKISRDLPNTIETRFEAIGLARNKRDNTAVNPFSAATNTRLDAIWTNYTARMTAIATAGGAYNSGTPVKFASAQELREFTSHFIQVFNFGVTRGKYVAGHRTYYNLPVEGTTLPDLSKETELLEWSSFLVAGDALRVAAGGAAMANPSVAELAAARTAFHNLFNAQSTNKDALDAEQEALEALLPEADKVIKKVWDELEAYYNEETDESRRENMREWGVIYVTTGDNKTMSGTVTYNGAPGAGLQVRFKNGKNKSICNAAGQYSLTTTLMELQKVIIEKLDGELVLKAWEQTVTLSESGNLTANFAVND